MLLSHPRFMLLYILFIVYQSDFSIGSNSLRILELKRDDLQNIVTLYLDQINKSSNHRYMIVIYNSTAKNFLENENEINTNRNFRRRHHMGLYYTKSKMLEEQLKRREEKSKHVRHIWGKEHQARLDYVNQTLLNRYRPTIYLFNEMKRILRDRQVLDPIRRMIVHLERPGNEAMHRAIMECYYKAKPPRDIDAWEFYNTNNLVKNTVRDPLNDNVP